MRVPAATTPGVFPASLGPQTTAPHPLPDSRRVPETWCLLPCHLRCSPQDRLNHSHSPFRPPREGTRLSANARIPGAGCYQVPATCWPSVLSP